MFNFLQPLCPPNQKNLEKRDDVGAALKNFVEVADVDLYPLTELYLIKRRKSIFVLFMVTYIFFYLFFYLFIKIKLFGFG